MEEKKVPKESWGRVLRNQFVTGLLVTIPLGASILILVWLFNSVDHILQPFIKHFWGHYIPGVGFAVTVVLIFVVGVIARNVVGRRLIKYGNSLLDRVPVFRMLYRGLRQIVESFASLDKTSFLQVVLVEFPCKGMKTIAFITNEITDKNGDKLLSVFIPTTPNPTSGYLEIFREEDVTRTQISVDAAIKMVVSAGRMMPDDVARKI